MRWDGARRWADGGGRGPEDSQAMVSGKLRCRSCKQQPGAKASHSRHSINACRARSSQLEPVSLKEAVNHRGSRKLPKGLGPSAEWLVKQSEKLNTLVLSCSLLGSPWARAVTAEAANPFPAPRLFPRSGPQDSVRSLLTPTLHTPVPFRLPRYPSL